MNLNNFTEHTELVLEMVRQFRVDEIEQETPP
jgi:hypothetical protein